MEDRTLNLTNYY